MSATRPDANGKPIKVDDNVTLASALSHRLMYGKVGRVNAFSMHGIAAVQFSPHVMGYFKGYELVLVEGEG